MTAEFLRSELLDPVPHGFFTRLGGVSEGPFAALNCGERSGDSLGNVAENRLRAAAALGLASSRLVTATQTHSTRVEVIRSVPRGERPTADGLVTDLPDVAVGVLTADCQPVLLADRTAGIVGAVHAGWSGTLGGVIESGVSEMERIGACRSRIAAAVGPAIGQANYEVGTEFRERFLAKDEGSSAYFAEDETGRLTFDLPGYGLERLRRAGVSTVEWLGECTYGDPRRFFSYRRSCHLNQPAFGLLISVIANSPPG